MKKAKIAVIITLSLALITIIIQNTEPVLTRFLWFSANIPAVVLLLLTAASSFVLGLVVAFFVKRDEKKPEEKEKEPFSEYTERTYKR